MRSRLAANTAALKKRTTVMPFVEWTDEFSVGVPEIDRDHQTLLSLLNKLHDAEQAGMGQETLGKVVGGLMFYVSYHCTHEEELFLRAKYPRYEEHRQQHEVLRSAVKEIYADFHAGAVEKLPQVALEFLKSWLYEHVMGADRDFAGYLNANPSALKPEPVTPH
jgi:hemerythrin-like metal-binding protein